MICWNPELDIFSTFTSFKCRLTIDASCRSWMTSNVLEIPTLQVGKSSPQLCNVVASHVAYMFGDIYEEFRLIDEVKYKASCDSIESTSSNQINGAAWSFTNRVKKLNRIYSIHVSLTTREVNALIALSINMLISHTQSYSVSRENLFSSSSSSFSIMKMEI